ncbi:MAG: hypothetical protein PHD36_09780 [Desulfotomaculaceae bacterium]|nr:hypothetical protein [Desulfotomaculaceae bacterium]
MAFGVDGIGTGGACGPVGGNSAFIIFLILILLVCGCGLFI